MRTDRSLPATTTPPGAPTPTLAAPRPLPAPHPPALLPPPAKSRAGFWRSFAAWGGIGLFSGLLNVGLKAALGSSVRTAFDPLVWKVNNTAQESLGARFNDSWSNPLKARVARFVAPPKQSSDATPSIFHPQLAAELVASFKRRSQADDRVRGQVDAFFTGTSRMMQMTCDGVGERLADNDRQGAARRLAAAITHDRLLRYELSPGAESLFALLYARLSPYFRPLPRAERDALVEATLTEVARLAPNAERTTALGHAEPIVRGLTLTGSDAPPRLVVGTAAHLAATKHASRELLALSLKTKADTQDGLLAYVDELFTKGVSSNGLFDQQVAQRARVRISKAVTRDLAAFEAKVNRSATLKEVWDLTTTAIETDASESVEWRATAASVGAFVTVGAVAAIPKIGMRKLDPAVAAALDPLVFTIVGFFMGAAGKFFKERLDAFGRAFSYDAPEKLTLGKALERDLLDNFLRVLTTDGRLPQTRAALMQFERLLHMCVIDAEESWRRGDLEGAAEFLSGAMQYLRQTHFEFSPQTRCFEIIAMKLGPHFDGMDEATITHLRELVTRDLHASGTDDQAMTSYYLPFIATLLGENVALARRDLGGHVEGKRHHTETGVDAGLTA